MFQFKQFTIHQERTPMKVGTDGVLLGAWAEVQNATRILDIGTGTGLLALMAAQRNHSAQIDALEIEPNACEQALENIQSSPWASRIHIIPTAVQDYTPDLLYDCILCNPPFFRQSTKAPDQGRSLARHNDTLPHPVLLEHISRLLTPQGNFHLILPTPEAIDAIGYAKIFQLFPCKITQVIPNPGKPPKRYLITFAFHESAVIEDELILEISRHQYTPAYKELTKEFYLR